MDELYGEQEIGSSCGDECHVKFISSLSQDEIEKDVKRNSKAKMGRSVLIVVIKSQRLLRHQGESVSNPIGSRTYRWPNLRIRRLSARH